MNVSWMMVCEGEVKGQVMIHRSDHLPPANFQTAKKVLAELYRNLPQPQSFYCQCPLRWPYADLKACSYYQDISSFTFSAAITTFEHLYPMARFKHKLTQHPHIKQLMHKACPRKNRGCLRTHIPLYKAFEADMIHIRPVIQKLNQLRGTKWFALTPLSRHQASQKRYHCQIKFSGDHFYPPDRIKGEIARIMLVLHKKYASIALFSDQEIDRFQSWSAASPLNPPESILTRQIIAHQDDPLYKEFQD